jgi:hypothetical protein
MEAAPRSKGGTTVARSIADSRYQACKWPWAVAPKKYQNLNTTAPLSPLAFLDFFHHKET